jgi:hypothetical protein
MSRDHIYTNHDHSAGLKPIGTIPPNWTPRWSYMLSAVQIHTTTHYMFYIEQLDPALPKAGPTCPSYLLRQVDGFLWVHRFHPPIKLAATT